MTAMAESSPPDISSAASHAISRLETAHDRLDFYGRMDTVALTLIDAIERVKSGEMRPTQGNSIALLCSTLIKALEVARGSTPAVSITAQLTRDEITEVLHGRDPFRPIIDGTPEPGQDDTAGSAAGGVNDPLAPSGGPA